MNQKFVVTQLSQNFIELFNDKDDYNVIIEEENKENSFTAHSNSSISAQIFNVILQLSQNFIELFNDKDDYNVIIEEENKENSFTAHSNVLKSRSSYFEEN
ncbi:hypothetical protein Glove_165g122 [Diversispora epigaea]|uniref:BTB domain-containing protein n=1 Tax=Diversispora epigaea TaxID=1348612 RepID=A0A397IX84_9GLOM|nr:hypothetical protein Glove_165g122 [Diversispora epigaea]